MQAVRLKCKARVLGWRCASGILKVTNQPEQREHLKVEVVGTGLKSLLSQRVSRAMKRGLDRGQQVP